MMTKPKFRFLAVRGGTDHEGTKALEGEPRAYELATMNIFKLWHNSNIICAYFGCCYRKENINF